MTQTLSPWARHRALERDWGSPKGWRSLSAVNHTVMGKRFMLAALAFFLVGGILALLMRAQLASHDSAFLDSELYSQIFTMHGTLMMFLFAIPMLEGFAFYLLPKMLGARDLAYPRLGAYAWWCYLFGGSILLIAMLLGLAPNSGWFMYTPLAGSEYRPGINSDVWLIGITFAEISAVCGAVELVATILKVRAPGMGLNKLPVFAWYMLVTAGMILAGFPPLILGSILLELERSLGWPFFDVARGGDPILWQHLFWLFGHPEVYIIFLPAAGMVSTMVPVFAQRPLVGYVWVVNSVIAVGFLSFGLWVHHMFTVGIPQLGMAFFSAASMLVAVPTAIQFFAWLATLWSGTVKWGVPMLYLAGFLFVFVIGGLTGVMLALVPFNVQVHDTHFVVAHLHYVLTGGLIFPLLAACHYWLPHITGRMPSGRMGSVAFWFIFIGFNLAFLPMHLTGLFGMPRRIYTYVQDMGWDALNQASSLGAFIQAVGFAIFLLDVMLFSRNGPLAPRNPWKAGGLEWAMATPPPSYNIASQPQVMDREPLWATPALGAQMAAGRHWLAQPSPGHRQTLSVDVVTGTPSAVLHLPGPGWLPLYSALTTAGFFLCVLFKLYAVSLGFAGLTLVLFLFWTWQGVVSARRITARDEVRLPAHGQVAGAPGWWGMASALIADGALFASLVFGCWYLRLFAPGWPTSGWTPVPWSMSIALCAGFLFMGMSAGRAGLAAFHEQTGRARGWLAATVSVSLLLLAGIAVLAVGMPDPTSHASAAAMRVLSVYMGLHAGLASVMAAYVLRRSWDRRAGIALDLSILRLWLRYTAVSGIVGVALLMYFPGVAL
ncbi:MAG: cytochrome c oxidase subunit I [Candidimonas sp.]